MCYHCTVGENNAIKKGRQNMNYISLGYFCSVAIDLEKLGLRSESSPFDWTIADFRGVISAIQSRFAGFLSYDLLAQNRQHLYIYKNIKYNISFYHDFDVYTPLKDQLSQIQTKYERRINRFYETIKNPPYLFDI